MHLSSISPEYQSSLSKPFFEVPQNYDNEQKFVWLRVHLSCFICPPIRLKLQFFLLIDFVKHFANSPRSSGRWSFIFQCGSIFGQIEIYTHSLFCFFFFGWRINFHWQFFQWFHSNAFTDGSETQQNIRAKRAKKPRTPGASAVVPEPDQRLDNDQSEDSSPVIPTGFLSPSVKEYLELGKSIPGRVKKYRV